MNGIARHGGPHGYDAAGLEAAWAHQVAVVRANPLEVVERKRLATLEFMRGRHGAALRHLATALMLPVDPAQTHLAAVDLAIVIPALVGMGQGHWLRGPHLRRALQAQPAVARAIYDDILSRLTNGNDLRLDVDDVRGVIDYFAGLGLTATGDLGGGSVYPRDGDRLVVAAVWMDVVVAGPGDGEDDAGRPVDPHRLEPLGTFLRMVDDLAETTVVGALWLGLGGDPLAHPQLADMIAYPAGLGLDWPVHVATRIRSLTPDRLRRLGAVQPAAWVVRADAADSHPASMQGLVELVARLVGTGWNGRLRLDLDLPDADQAAPLLRRWLEWAAAIAVRVPGLRAIRQDTAAQAGALAEAARGGGELALWWWDGAGGAPGMASLAPLVPDRGAASPVADGRGIADHEACGYAATAGLALHGSGRLGVCPLDPEGEAWFGVSDDFDRLDDALYSPEATRLLAELANGIATRSVCRTCPQMRAKP